MNNPIENPLVAWEGESPPPEPGAQAAPASQPIPITELLGGDERVYQRSGGTTVFLRLGAIGLRLYKNEADRDLGYEAQRRAASVGAAPAVGVKFELGDGVYSAERYGYVTEAAEQQETGYGFWDVDSNADRARFNELWGRMERVGCRIPADRHNGNHGRLRGELVWLDFSAAQLTEPQG